MVSLWISLSWMLNWLCWSKKSICLIPGKVFVRPAGWGKQGWLWEKVEEWRCASNRNTDALCQVDQCPKTLKNLKIRYLMCLALEIKGYCWWPQIVYVHLILQKTREDGGWRSWCSIYMCARCVCRPVCVSVCLEISCNIEEDTACGSWVC